MPGEEKPSTSGLLDQTRKTIVAIERDRYDPSVGLAIRIARVFADSVEEVFVLR